MGSGSDGSDTKSRSNSDEAGPSGLHSTMSATPVPAAVKWVLLHTTKSSTTFDPPFHTARADDAKYDGALISRDAPYGMYFYLTSSGNLPTISPYPRFHDSRTAHRLLCDALPLLSGRRLYMVRAGESQVHILACPPNGKAAEWAKNNESDKVIPFIHEGLVGVEDIMDYLKEKGYTIADTLINVFLTASDGDLRGDLAVPSRTWYTWDTTDVWPTVEIKINKTRYTVNYEFTVSWDAERQLYGYDQADYDDPLSVQDADDIRNAGHSPLGLEAGARDMMVDVLNNNKEFDFDPGLAYYIVVDTNMFPSQVVFAKAVLEKLRNMEDEGVEDLAAEKIGDAFLHDMREGAQFYGSQRKDMFFDEDANPMTYQHLQAVLYFRRHATPEEQNDAIDTFRDDCAQHAATGSVGFSVAMLYGYIAAFKAFMFGGTVLHYITPIETSLSTQKYRGSDDEDDSDQGHEDDSSDTYDLGNGDNANPDEEALPDEESWEVSSN